MFPFSRFIFEWGHMEQLRLHKFDNSSVMKLGLDLQTELPLKYSILWVILFTRYRGSHVNLFMKEIALKGDNFTRLSCYFDSLVAP